jgi:hypothetical protein
MTCRFIPYLEYLQSRAADPQQPVDRNEGTAGHNERVPGRCSPPQRGLEARAGQLAG